MKHKSRGLAALIVIIAATPAAHAQLPVIVSAPIVISEEVPQPAYPNSNAIAFDVGEAAIYPGVSLQFGSVDNVFSQVSPDAATETSHFTLSPRVDYIASGAKQTLWLGYLGNYRQHADAPQADFQDHRLSVNSHTAFDSRRRLDLEASVAQSHQSIGLSRTLNFSDADIDALEEVDTYRINKVGAAFSYGNPSVKGELVGGLAGGSIAFNSNEDETRQNDRDFTLAWSQLYYRISPRTRVFGNVILRSLDYDQPNEDGVKRDADTTTVSAGVVWELSGLWFGSVSLRNRQWDFDASTLEDSKSVLADAKLFWLWKPYSRFEFSLFEQVNNSVISAGVSENSALGVTWRHEWNDKISTRIKVQTVSQEEADGSSNSDYSQVGAELRFAPRRWLQLVGGLETQNIDKIAGNAETRNLYLGAIANL